MPPDQDDPNQPTPPPPPDHPSPYPGGGPGFTPTSYEPSASAPPPGSGTPPPGPPPTNFGQQAQPPQFGQQQVASTPLAGPAMSPDGRFWWNGYQWVPVGGQSKGGCGKAFVVGCGVLAVLFVIGLIILAIVGDDVLKHANNIIPSINGVFPNSANGIDLNNFTNQFNNVSGN